MTTSLPEGIITNTDSISADIEQVDAVTVEDVQRLWKVYSTNKNVLRRNSGRRLENLFWRIWGDNGRLCRVLSGSAVARIFNYISDDHDIIRTTPVPSPRARQRRLEFSDPFPRSEENASPSGGRDDVTAQYQTEAVARVSPPESSTTVTPLQPILKKSREAGGGIGNASIRRDMVTTFDTGVVGGEGDSTGVSPTSVGGPTSASKAQDGSKRKKTAFVAGSSSGRRRPVVARRKSSQSSGGNVPSVRSPTAPAIHEVEEHESSDVFETESTVKEEGSSSARISPQQAGPVGGSSRGEPRQENRRIGGLFTNLSTPALAFLSREDQLRAGPSDKRRQDMVAALSSRPLVTKTSATLASTSTAAQGTVEMGQAPSPTVAKGRQAMIIDEVVPLKPAAAAAVMSSGSAMVDDASSDVAGEGPLPRTKSQLTLLLERDRQQVQQGQGQHERGRKGRKASA